MQLIDTVARGMHALPRILVVILSLGISLADVICVSTTYLYSAVHVCLTYTRPIEVSREVVACTPDTAVCARDALDIFLAPVHTRTDLPYCACGSVRFRVPALAGCTLRVVSLGYPPLGYPFPRPVPTP